MRNPTISAISCGMPIRCKRIAAVTASAVMPNAFVKSARTTSDSRDLLSIMNEARHLLLGEKSDEPAKESALKPAKKA
jgi:hypothetical protein